MSENETHPNADGASSNALQSVTGTVKWFDPRKGFGFIIGPDGKIEYAGLPGSFAELTVDALLAGDKRHHGRTAQGDDPVIDLAREKTQRQADDAGAMAQHPLDRVGGLACIGGAEHSADAPRVCKGI
jgi:hypothetical protein